MEILFWFSLFFIFYAYFGYPFLLQLLSTFKRREVIKGDYRPKISLIITAYNEEKRIGEKLENTLQLDYPRDHLEIIVASDCSTDRTDEIVKSYSNQGIRLVRAPERKGKENAQKHAVDAASGDILVFSDTATRLGPESIRHIVSNFNDPSVGCVSSVDKFIDKEGKVSGEGAYVRYEMWLRNLESRVNTLVGLSGSFFAARKEVCDPWQTNLQSDFNTLLNSVKKGLRGVSDSDAVGYYADLADEKKEFNRKVRTVVRGISVFMNSLSLLNPLGYGIFSWQIFSHKLCRWLVPFALILALLTTVTLALNSQVYAVILFIHLTFYMIAVLNLKLQSEKQLVKIPMFFLMVNLSILIAWFKYMRGERFVTWQPSRR